ncbi:hypothetical protein E3U36_04980 [Arsenophonus endosymbiont of Aphis craccivora]|uniref:hypothetical protein n=1 Tax=Arsenophonus endosymbiont of Aphis craccivora TaxID=1231049 RepID=UPI0015DCCB67|nr:hypothetical protein [Arsenophonus endosymbiont of Aphis craccivora]QLK87652.1 hypothetical protein E3U36_04980 [Arsenophonus endosymbiont of Aphis craccivora]
MIRAKSKQSYDYHQILISQAKKQAKKIIIAAQAEKEQIFSQAKIHGYCQGISQTSTALALFIQAYQTINHNLYNDIITQIEQTLIQFLLTEPVIEQILGNLVAKVDLQQQSKIYLPEKLATTLSEHWSDKFSNIKLTSHQQNCIMLEMGNEILYLSPEKSVTEMMKSIIADKQIAASNQQQIAFITELKENFVKTLQQQFEHYLTASNQSLPEADR